ncbi:DUF2971 domain-containing protein [Gracilimonas sediminicola]|uniref:DUF2971 domain-containing protein n=1 Tax=Gracilimonas sediminicola TaxID=2952158 RepID=UPI0038D4E071
MRAYKFRSSNQIEYVFDILIKKRLHCADWKDLNDPMEGMYYYQGNGRGKEIEEKVKGIRRAKRKYKVCSLSKTYDSHLLWAHYANGFKGVAIELDLPGDDPNIREVDSRGVFAFVDMNNFRTEEEAARTILFSKYREWKYEQEVRILHDEKWYKLTNPITRVIAGPRMDDSLFKVLNIVCTKLGVEINKLGIGDEGLDIDPVHPIEDL